MHNIWCMKIKNGLIMKFLHTSDLHIGKKLDGKSRIDEQAQVLSEIVGICEAEKVDVVLLAGDVFDTVPDSGRVFCYILTVLFRCFSSKS